MGAEHAHELAIGDALGGGVGGVERGGHAFPAAGFVPGEPGDDKGTEQKDDGLDRLGDGHSGESADYGVDAGEGAHQEDAGPFFDAENVVQDQPAGGEREGDVEDDRSDDRDDCEQVAAFAAVAFFEEIREGGDLGFQIERGEEETEQDQGEGGHPLEIAVEQASVVARLGEADEVDAGDVGGEERKADDGPFQGVSCHEIVTSNGLALLLALFLSVNPSPTAEADDSSKINNDDSPVENADLHGIGFYGFDESALGGGITAPVVWTFGRWGIVRAQSCNILRRRILNIP